LLSAPKLLADVSDTIAKAQQIEVIGYRESIEQQFSTSTSFKLYELKSMNLQQITEAIKFIPGTFINDYGGLGGIKTVSLRGQSSSQNMVMLDGMKINQSASGSFDFSILPTSMVDEISIYKGGMSAFFGGGAIGGALNIIPAPGDREGLAASVLAGSFGTYKTTIKVLTNLFKSSQSTVVEYNYSQGNYPYPINDFGNNITYKRNNGDFKSLSFFFVNQYSGKLFKFKTDVFATTSDRGSPGAVIYGKPENLTSRLRNKSLFVVLIGEKQLPAKNTLKLSALYNLGSTKYRDDWNEFYGLPLVTEYLNNDFSLKVKHTKNFRDFVNEFTVDYTLSALSGDMLQTTTSNNIMRNEFSGLWSGSYFKTFTNFEMAANTALRFNKVGDFKPFLSPFVGMTGKINNLSTTMKLNYSYNFRAPSFNEMYYLNYGNTDLLPEYSHSYNFEITNNTLDFLDFSAVLFYMDTKDKIISVPKSVVSWSAENLGRVINRGFELGAGINLFKRCINLNISYTRQKATDETDNSLTKEKILVYTPQEILTASVIYSKKPHNLGCRFYYSSHIFSLPDNSYSSVIPNYFLVDIFGSRTWTISETKLTVSFSFNNIFDKQYTIISNYPMPGRNATLKVNVGI
jgi:outer membrane cobalamin receptor